MSETAASRAVREARREVAPVNRDDDHPRIAEPKAQVLLLPGRFRGPDYIRRHVEFVVGLDAERGEQHVQRNLDAIRRRLDEMGVGKRDADREVRSIEGAVRAAIWRQVLLP